MNWSGIRISRGQHQITFIILVFYSCVEGGGVRGGVLDRRSLLDRYEVRLAYHG